MYQEQCNLAFQLLVKSQMLDMPIDLKELMHYPLSPVPHALGTPDGFFAKTNKATILHYLLQDRDEEVTYPKDVLFIQDGNALFHMMTNLWPDLHAAPGSYDSQEALCLLHRLLPARLDQSPGEGQTRVH